MNKHNLTLTNTGSAWFRRVAAGVALGAGKLAYAQTTTASFTQLNTTLQNIVSLLSGAGVLVVTVAIAWAGYKMIFQHARWADIATVVLGAMLIGASAVIAQWLVG